jgi:RNA polymerase sigma factor (sigma-70 family)
MPSFSEESSALSPSLKRDSVTRSEGVHRGEGSAPTSSGMLRAAQADDQEAWRRLVHLYSRRMYRWCRIAGLQPADASNAVQESFAAVARNLHSFRHLGPNDTFRGWLRRIVENKIRDHYRQTSRAVDRPLGGSDAMLRLAGVAEPEVLDSCTQPEVVDWSPARESELCEPTWHTTRPLSAGSPPAGPACASSVGIEGAQSSPSEVQAAISRVRNQVSERLAFLLAGRCRRSIGVRGCPGV